MRRANEIAAEPESQSLFSGCIIIKLPLEDNNHQRIKAKNDFVKTKDSLRWRCQPKNIESSEL
jgi:hypothetical protein